MGTAMMIDGFVGNPQELYALVVEEINRRELPGITYGWTEDVESTKLFRKGASAATLTVSFRGFTKRILAYQVCRIFHVSLRTTTRPDMGDLSVAGYLHIIANNIYEEIVSRSLKDALRRHLAAHEAPIPKELDLSSIFLTPDEAKAAGG